MGTTIWGRGRVSETLEAGYRGPSAAFVDCGVMERPVPAPRASDHDREAVVERLRQAVTDGRLDMVEFDERVEAAYVARTRHELVPLLSDLPEQTSATAVEPVQIRGFMSSHQRTRRWPVPARLRARLTMSSLRLNLTEADLPPLIELDVSLVMSSIDLIVPVGVRVEVDGLRDIMSSLANRTHHSGSGPLLRVHGRAVMSSVTLRHPHAIVQWWRSNNTGSPGRYG